MDRNPSKFTRFSKPKSKIYGIFLRKKWKIETENYEELTKILIEKWIKLSNKKYFINSIRKYNRVIEINGISIEESHLREIKEGEKKEKMKKLKKA